MTTMATVTCASGEWTLAYTAAADVDITLQNQSADTPIKVRVGSAAVVGDSLDSACFIVMPWDRLALGGLVTGDKVFLAPHRSTSSGDVSPVRAVVWSA